MKIVVMAELRTNQSEDPQLGKIICCKQGTACLFKHEIRVMFIPMEKLEFRKPSFLEADS